MTTASTCQLLIEPLSPLVLRSGRPFGATGQTGSASGSSTPLPGTMAGTLRAAWCDAQGYLPYDQDSDIDRLHLHGPLQATWGDHGGHGGHGGAGGPAQAKLWLPPPANARAVHGRESAVALRPTLAPAGAGCDLPFGMLPLLPPAAPRARLDLPPPGLWSLPAVVDWLLERGAVQARAPWQTSPLLALPQCAEPVHIRTDASRQVEEGAFFVNLACDYTLPSDQAARHGCRGLWLRCEVPALTPRQLAARTPPTAADDLLRGFDGVAGQAWRLGADGALACVSRADSNEQIGHAELARLDTTLAALKAGGALCLVLATPGCFGRNGWYPWLRRDELAARGTNGRRLPLPSQPVPEGRLLGWPPGWRFRLRAAAVGAPVPQGSLKARSGREAKPLPQARRQQPGPHTAASGLGQLQWLVPAGSMYWFEVLQTGEPPAPGSLQLRPCSEAQFARDGHALALYAAAPALPLPAGPAA